ncbi:hypothetical protein F5883DRAFT_526403 [Diaporthe sp. PMI_573]|nr:hypothetical protein F5883DRAFT_526403 [Diaporthaceae sp. PMI_573]
MANQQDVNNSDQAPKVVFNHILWPGPVVKPGPYQNDGDDGVIDNGEGPSFRVENINLPSPMLFPATAPDTIFGADISQPSAQEAAAVDTPMVSSEPPVRLNRTPSTIFEVINEGNLRDSLDLDKYKPLSRTSSQVSPLAGAGEANMPPVMDMPFSRPPTMVHGGRASDALNVVRPYPNLSFMRARTAPVSVAYLPNGNVMVTSKMPAEPQSNEGEAEAGKPTKAATRRFSRVVARIMRKDKSEGGPWQSGGILKQLKPPAKDKGKAKVVDFVDPAMPGCSKDVPAPTAEGFGPMQVDFITKPLSMMEEEGKGKGKAVEVVAVAVAGQPALPHEGGHAAAAGGPQVGATIQVSRDGKKVDLAIRSVRRKVRRVVVGTGRQARLP